MKKILLLLIFIFLFCYFATAQQDTSLIYVNNSGSVVLNKSQADHFIAILPPEPEQDPNLFTVKEYYTSGKIMLECMSASRTMPLNFQGPCVIFYENGHRKQFKTFVNGVVEGDVINYYPNGQLHTISHTTDNTGKKYYLTECRDSTGKVLSKDGNGQWLNFSPDFKSSSGGPIVNGKEDGEWHGYLGDSIKFICLFKKGDLKSGIGYDAAGKAYPFNKIYVEPKFGHGVDVFKQFLNRNQQYPDYAKAHNLKGTVRVGFTVEKDGTVDNFIIITSVAPSLDEEALRVVRLSPSWIPGRLYGVPISVKFSYPMLFY